MWYNDSPYLEFKCSLLCSPSFEKLTNNCDIYHQSPFQQKPGWMVGRMDRSVNEIALFYFISSSETLQSVLYDGHFEQISVWMDKKENISRTMGGKLKVLSKLPKQHSSVGVIFTATLPWEKSSISLWYFQGSLWRETHLFRVSFGNLSGHCCTTSHCCTRIFVTAELFQKGS